MATGYKLWIDDQAFDKETPERHPPDNSWYVARSSKEAIDCINKHGPPSFIDFDHDLGMIDGKEDTAKPVCKYLANNYYDADIGYHIHSANPAGAAWIKSYMDSWKKSKET